jgi:bacterioferritin (cytochrome b1)
VSNQKSTIINELRALLRLTETEIQIAETRRAQARTRAVERELAENANNARKRAAAIADTLRHVGGTPDLVTTIVGRLGATAKASLEQAQPLSEALLGDLALEHQLQDRARFLHALATAAEDKRVVRLAERLDKAHQATIDWLTTVLAELAIGGPAALRPTPIQAVVGTGVQIATLPARTLTSGVNSFAERAAQLRGRATATAESAAEKAAETVADVRDTVADVRETVSESVTAGRNASLSRAETVTRRQGRKGVANSLHDTRRDVGALDDEELPIKGYGKLSQPKAVAAVKELDKVEDVQAVLAYEEAHKNRPSIVSAAQVKIADLAKDTVPV